VKSPQTVTVPISAPRPSVTSSASPTMPRSQLVLVDSFTTSVEQYRPLFANERLTATINLLALADHEPGRVRPRPLRVACGDPQHAHPPRPALRPSARTGQLPIRRVPEISCPQARRTHVRGSGASCQPTRSFSRPLARRLPQSSNVRIETESSPHWQLNTTSGNRPTCPPRGTTGQPQPDWARRRSRTCSTSRVGRDSHRNMAYRGHSSSSSRSGISASGRFHTLASRLPLGSYTT
jgi:hypothetical protein